MRTATTLHKTGKGWILKHDPDVPFAKQKADFGASVEGKWPDGVFAIRFQVNDGKAKLLDSSKAKNRTEARAQAELNAEAKLLKQSREAKEARNQSAIAELETQICRQKERVEVFKSKVAASKDAKWNAQFVIEHKQAKEILADLEKQHAKLKAELADLTPKASATAAS